MRARTSLSDLGVAASWVGAYAGDSGDVGRSNGGGAAAGATQGGAREGDYNLPRYRQARPDPLEEAQASRASGVAPSLQQQQQASMISARQARPGRVQWAPERGGRAPSSHERLPQIAEAAGLQPENDDLQRQQQLRRQPSGGQPGGEARGAGGSLLGRTGLFRSRSSSDREEARASEMSLVTRSPSAQQEQHRQQQAQLVGGQVHQGNALQEQGLSRMEQHPLSTGDQGHLSLPVEPSWAQEGEELSGDFLLGSQAGDDAAPYNAGLRTMSAEQHGDFHFADDRGSESPHGRGGSFDRGSAQLIAPPQGWHAGAVHELQSAHSGGLFEPLHEAMLDSPSGAHASTGSSLAWHDDDQGPPDLLEGEVETGFGGSLGSSLHGSHEEVGRGVGSAHWDAHGL